MQSKTLCLLLLGTFLLWGCDNEAVNGNQSLTVFKHALDGSPNSLDPAHASTVNAKFLVVNLYDTLYRYKYLARPYELIPNLAEDLPEISPDGTRYTIKIKAGTFFHDDKAFTGGKGREVVADDFIYSIQRQFDQKTRAQGRWMWADQIVGLKEWMAAGSDYSQAVSGLKRIDRYTLEITLKEANPLFTHTLAQGFAALVPHEGVEYWGPEFSSHPVGSGPFQLQSFSTTEAVLIANKQYRQEAFSITTEGGVPAQYPRLQVLEGHSPPFVDRIELPFIKDETARWNALISHTVDSILVPSTLLGQVLANHSEVAKLQSPVLKASLQDQYNILSTREAGFVHIDFNLDDPAIGYLPDPEKNSANHALRCAVRMAYDWDARNRIFSHGTGRVFSGVIPPVVNEFMPGLNPESIRRNLPAARQLLEKYNWTPENLPILTYGYAISVNESQMFEQFRGFLMELGYPAEKIQARRFANFGDFFRALNESNINVIPSGWEMDYPDATDTLQLFYGPNHTPGANHSNFNNPEFNQLFRQARHMPVSVERTAIFQRLNKIVIDACVSISGLARTRIFVWNKRARVVPDRAFTGGYFLRFAALDLQ